MKAIKFSIIAILFTSVFAFVACGSSHSHDHDHDGEQTEKQGKEYTSAFICPMHCAGSGSAEAGKCPECGMDYVPNKNQTPAKEPAAEHNHDHHDHDHNHDHDH